MEYFALVGFLLLALALVRRLRRSASGCQTIGSLRERADVERLGGRSRDPDEARFVELRGRVRCPDARRAPLSGRDVVGFWAVVERERGVTGWEPVVELSECEDFVLEDETGTICVRAGSSPVVLDVGERRGRGGPFRPMPAAVLSLLDRSSDGVHGVLFVKGFRWRERVLVEGQEIRVRGRVTRRLVDEPRGYRQLGQELVLVGGGDRPVTVHEARSRSR